MKKFVFTAMLVLCAMSAAAADVSGKWTGAFTPEADNASQGVLVLKQTGDTVTGTAGPSESEQTAISNGKIEGDRVTFEIQQPNGMIIVKLVLSGDSLKGDVEASHDGQTMRGKLDLTRVKS